MQRKSRIQRQRKSKTFQEYTMWDTITVKLKPSFMYGNTVVLVVEKIWCTYWTKCTKIWRKGKILWWWREISFCVWKVKEFCFIMRWSLIYRRRMCSHVPIICKIAALSWFWTSSLWGKKCNATCKGFW